MKARQRSIPSETLLADRFEWLQTAYNAFNRGGAKAYLESQPPVDLLLSGLRRSEPDRWDIGIIDAKPASNPVEEGPSIIFTYKKPKERRAPDEADSTDRQFDPPAVLLQQLHIIFGGRLRLKTSESHVTSPDHPKGIPYHYPIIGIRAPKRFEFRVLRAILDAPADKLATGEERFHDLRRCNLSAPWLTQQQATEKFGPQNRRRSFTRNDAMEASLRAFDLGHPQIGVSLSREAFREALTKGYRLLDCHPLKPRDSN
jgi:hypothetical protein